MNQRALSTVLLRVFAITYFFSTVSSVTTQAIFLYGLYTDGNEKLGTGVTAALSIFWLNLFATLVFSLVLLALAPTLSARCFKKDQPVITAGTIDHHALLHVGILLVGAYLFIHAFPPFLVSAIQWFKLQALQSSDVYMSGANEALLKSGIKMVLIVFVLFRSRSICRFLVHNTK